MKCPVCATPDLVMSERSGVEIDYCPQCRGIWLDRGELDKILERAATEERGSVQPPYKQQRQVRSNRSQETRRHGDSFDSFDLLPGEFGGKRERRKSWWMEIFD
jgi:Zn-finger nucleic acid-binding protein